MAETSEISIPKKVLKSIGCSQKEYERSVVTFSVKNQLRYKGNLIKTLRKDERRYYEDLLQYSRDHLMLYPYHLSDVVVKGLRITPFSYYIDVMSDIMTQEKSYDSLPNFTAADCLRLLGIGRNQYIDLMNQCRSTKKFFRRKPAKDLLPLKPVDTVTIEPWWIVNTGYITEDDIRMCSQPEKNAIDSIIDSGPQTTGDTDYRVVLGLYRKGFVYLDAPIADEDYIIVPPLEGFVMNRVLGDYFETLLYKIFVSIDEHTTVAELASVLQIDLQLVKNAVSMYCRLGFARKKRNESTSEDLHPSWNNVQTISKKPNPDELLIDWTTADVDLSPPEESAPSPTTVSISSLENAIDANSQGPGGSRRIAFLFDSTLTAFLMMGNLSPGLKSHAVTMFEVGKLSDESLDSFQSELEKVGTDAEGEAQRYFDHAITLRDTIRFLRHNKNLFPDPENNSTGLAVDLIRCESLLGLDAATRSRVLNKNYGLLVSMAPLSNEIRPVTSCKPPHIGPAIPEVNSVWFKLFIYQLTGCGPPSLLLVKGTKIKRLPKMFQVYDRLLVTTWGHDPGLIATSNILLSLNDALSHSAVLIQAHGMQSQGRTMFVPFPLDVNNTGPFSRRHLHTHSAVQKLAGIIDIRHTCGYITLLNCGNAAGMHNSESKVEGVTRVHQSPEHTTPSDKPLNGFKDVNAANILASELDSMEIDSKNQSSEKSVSKTGMTLNFASQDEIPEELIENAWTLLDCWFGIPLFDSPLNKDVCSRVASNNLCDTESLNKLLFSSRKLSLMLLNFISKFQDSTSFDDGNGELFTTAGSTEQSCPYPTQNLMFLKGGLQKWNGQ